MEVGAEGLADVVGREYGGDYLFRGYVVPEHGDYLQHQAVGDAVFFGEGREAFVFGEVVEVVSSFAADVLFEHLHEQQGQILEVGDAVAGEGEYADGFFGVADVLAFVVVEFGCGTECDFPPSGACADGSAVEVVVSSGRCLSGAESAEVSEGYVVSGGQGVFDCSKQRAEYGGCCGLRQAEPGAYGADEAGAVHGRGRGPVV